MGKAKVSIAIIHTRTDMAQKPQIPTLQCTILEIPSQIQGIPSARAEYLVRSNHASRYL
jgi:hypothetical protein